MTFRALSLEEISKLPDGIGFAAATQPEPSEYCGAQGPFYMRRIMGKLVLVSAPKVIKPEAMA